MVAGDSFTPVGPQPYTEIPPGATPLPGGGFTHNGDFYSPTGWKVPLGLAGASSAPPLPTTQPQGNPSTPPLPPVPNQQAASGQVAYQTGINRKVADGPAQAKLNATSGLPPLPVQGGITDPRSLRRGTANAAPPRFTN